MGWVGGWERQREREWGREREEVVKGREEGGGSEREGGGREREGGGRR